MKMKTEYELSANRPIHYLKLKQLESDVKQKDTQGQNMNDCLQLSGVRLDATMSPRKLIKYLKVIKLLQI